VKCLKLEKEPRLGDEVESGWRVVAVSRPDKLLSVARLGDAQDVKRWRLCAYEVAA
jgi:hypothetical protein